MRRPIRHRATIRFWDSYRSLPAEIRSLADASFQTLKRDPRHPALHFKKAAGLWSARVGLHHRALAIEDDGGYIWLWIGTHSEYDHMLRSRR